jgi:hypothetical protein
MMNAPSEHSTATPNHQSLCFNSTERPREKPRQLKSEGPVEA